MQDFLEEKASRTSEIVFNFAIIIISFSENVNHPSSISAHYMNLARLFYVFRLLLSIRYNRVISYLPAMPFNGSS